MKIAIRGVSLFLLAVATRQLADGATLNGNSFALKSNGQPSGSSYVLDRNGYVGTYITLAAPANVKIDVSADGAGGAAMGVAVGDAVASFAVASGTNTYSHTFSLPAGTHFVRTELNNDRGVAGRQLKINSLSVTGATLANSNSNANALAASDTYIANYRRGSAAVAIRGLSGGEQVSVSLKRIAFDFGAGVHIPDQGGLLDNMDTIHKQNYQKYLNENFNTVATAGPAYWESNEPTRGTIEMRGVNELFAYAQAHNMHTRLHNLLFDEVQPNWVDTLKSEAVTNTAAKADLLSAINSRIGYYVGNQSSQYGEIDIYNESYNQGQNGDPDSYWHLYGPDGIAAIYRNSKLAAADAGYAPKLFVNDSDALQDSDYGNGYMRNIETLRQAGIDAGFGEIVGGIGLQNYEAGLRPDLASQFIAGLQNMNIQKLPTVLTEFGTFADVSADDSATILNQSLRLVFGNPSSTGFLIWDWTKEDDGHDQFAPGSALYTVSTQTWNDFAITPAGKVWQDLLGIHDWDGDPTNGWNTQLTATADASGRINFNGFYGDYDITVDGKTYQLHLTKGVSNYVLGDASTLDGDFNGDGLVDAADYTVWRDGPADFAGYQKWKMNFGRSLAKSTTALLAPEPASPLALVSLAMMCSRLRIRLGREGEIATTRSALGSLRRDWPANSASYTGVKSASDSMPSANSASRSAARSISSNETISTALCM